MDFSIFNCVASMGRASALAVSEKVLIHLSRMRVDQDAELAPREISQEGIAEGVGISRSHVPRAVKELLQQGLIAEHKRHIKDGEKRVKVYLVTSQGLAKAREIESRGLAQVMTAKIQNTLVQGMTLRQLENSFHRRIDLLKITGNEEYLDLDVIATTGVTDFSDSPKIALFLDREAPLEQMKHFLKSHALLLAIYGAKGIGTSSLVKHFIEMLDEWNILWISLSKYRTLRSVRDRIVAFSKLIGTTEEALTESAAGANCIIVFDGYFDVNEEIVEYLSDLGVRHIGAKIIVTCRDSTPSYNRFYSRDRVDAGIVMEMTVKGLPEREARDLLGNPEIPEEAFKRVYALSRGSPMVLSMLRERDEEGLKRNTTFTNEEIRFLLIESLSKPCNE